MYVVGGDSLPIFRLRKRHGLTSIGNSLTGMCMLALLSQLPVGQQLLPSYIADKVLAQVPTP